MTGKLKVLIINTSADRGGAAAVAKGLYKSLKTRPDIDSIFISGRKSEDASIQSINTTRLSFLTNVMMFRLLGHEGFLNGKAWLKVLENYLDWADVVHLHNIHGYYLPHSVVEKILVRPTVWTLHDYWLLTGRCAFPNTCRGYIDACEKCNFLGRYPAAWLDYAKREFLIKRKYIAESEAIFVTPSNASRQMMIDMGMPTSRIAVIENPLLGMPEHLVIQEKSVARKSLLLSSEKKIALFVANMVDEPRKGFSTLYKSLQMLGEANEWQLVVIGNVTSASLNSATQNVLFVGPIADQQRLFKYFMASDIFVNPSLSETFGLVNIEAVACGCPVICSDLPVFRELDHGGVNYFEVGNAEQLADFLRNYDHNSFTGNERIRTVNAVRERFSLNHAIEQYIKLYKQVFAGTNV
jgi:putative colanic acid biosynthesis glycosyltransferase